MPNVPTGAATAAAFANWTDEELCRELAAWQCGGGGARLPASRVLEAQAEYDRRVGIEQPSEEDVFNRLRDRLGGSTTGTGLSSPLTADERAVLASNSEAVEELTTRVSCSHSQKPTTVRCFEKTGATVEGR